MTQPSPLTTFLCDVVDFQAGKVARTQLQAWWKSGKYQGVKPEYAAWQLAGGK